MREYTSLVEHTFYHRHRKAGMKKALPRMRTKKAMGPNGIPPEASKWLKEIKWVWLTRLFNRDKENVG